MKEEEIFSMKQMETLLAMFTQNKEQIKGELNLFVNSVQKMEKQFRSMKEDLKPVLMALKTYDEKHAAHYKMAKSLINYMRDIDTKVDAIRSVLEIKMSNIGKEIDDAWDALRGLRLKTDQEPILVGDIVWVDYTAEVVDGERKGQKFEEKNFPVRVGSKSVAFEDLLNNKFLGTTFTEEKPFPKEEFKNWEWAGNRIKFNITILKIKTATQEA